MAIRVRRAELGKSQEQVALDSGVLNQTTVSELEGGRYDLANLTAARLAGLARGLDWSLAEMERKLEVDFGLGSYEEMTLAHPLPPPSQDFTVEVPAELLEAAEIYKSIDPLIAHPTVQQQLARAGFFGGGPQTAQQWVRYFNDVREWIKVDN